MRKRLAIALIAILCMIGVTGFSPKAVLASVDTSNTTVTGEVDDQDTYKSTAEAYLGQWNDYDFSTVEDYKDQMSEEEYKTFKEWNELQQAAGEAKSIIEEKFEVDEETKNIICTMIVAYEKDNLQFKFTFDTTGNFAEQVQIEKYVEEKADLGETMKKAGLNTVMAICIVFVVLVFIALIISLFKFIPMLMGANKKNKEPVQEAAPAVAAPVVEDVTNDTEIVAVITAAIMASMGSEAPADGLHITSIKRRVNSKWKKGGF